MAFQSAEQEKPVESGILFVLFQKCSAYGFEKLSIIVRCCSPLEFFEMDIAIFPRFVFKDGAIEFLFIGEITKNDGFVDVRLRGQVSRRRTSKALFCEKLHRRCEDVVPAVMFHK